MVRPKGHLQPPTEELQSLRLIVEQKDAGALARLGALVPANDIERSWLDYLSGLALFNGEQFDEGTAAFQSAVNRAANSNDSDLNRLAGMSLKKIGWNFRRQNKFQDAFDFHFSEYQIFERHGSPEDLHDAAVSLDVDCYEMKDFVKSEVWIRSGIQHAAQIGNSLRRNRALGMSFNNLSGTLCELNRFDEALDAMHTSEQRWMAYESEHGSGEFRLVWVQAGYGTVYQKWAEYLKSQSQNYSELASKAADAFRSGLSIAAQLEMPASDQRYLEESLASVESL